MKKTVLLGVTGSIAAFKSLELIKLLKKEGIGVFVIMTKNAARIVNLQEFEKATGNKIYTKLFEENFDYKKILENKRVDHIELAKKADLMVIAPATANTVGKLAHGFADDFLTTTTLALTCPIIICPSMNVNMWNHPIVLENINKLKSVGYRVIEPVCGMLACGTKGKGRLQDINIIKDEILANLNRNSQLKRKKIIVTAGGTIEKIDEVRHIANRSSGKMGIAIAEECFLRGADVLLLRSKTSVKPRYLINEETFTDTKELFDLIKKHVKNFSEIYHAAAVSDFKIKKFRGKVSSKKSLTIKLLPQIKILNEIKKINPKIKLIAFKAEYGSKEKELIEKAKEKLIESNSDAIIANDVSKAESGFESDNNEVVIVLKNGETKKISLAPKRDVAKEILDFLRSFEDVIHEESG